MTFAEDNPAALRLPFVEDIVRENLGTALTTPVSSDPAQVEFLVESGDYGQHHRDRLEDQGLIADSRAFVFIATVDELTGALQQGTFILRKNMTPDQLVSALLAPPTVKYVDIGLRTGLRLEQITAKLETLRPDLQMDACGVLRHRQVPAADAPRRLPVAQDDPQGRPQGRVARGLPVAGDLPRPARHDARGAGPADARQVRGERRPRADGRREGARPELLPDPDPRLDRRARGAARRRRSRSSPASTRTGSTRRSGPSASSSRTRPSSTSTTRCSSPSIPVTDWTKYVFWAPIKGGLTDETLPADLAGYNTYTSQGLPPGPIDTPTLTSIDAALEPDTKDGYSLLPGQGRRDRDDGLRQDPQGTPGEHQEVHEAVSRDVPAQGCRVPADFAGRTIGGRPRALGCRRIAPHGPHGWRDFGHGSLPSRR